MNNIKVDLLTTFCYVIDESLQMSKGKIAAQVSHVAMMIANKHPGIVGRAIVLKTNHTQFVELLNRYATMNSVFIEDAGLTEVAPGTVTCIGFIQTLKTREITKHMKLV